MEIRCTTEIKYDYESDLKRSCNFNGSVPAFISQYGNYDLTLIS